MQTVSYLDRLLEPATDSMPLEFARALLALRASPEIAEHVGELREKANTGALTPDEEIDYRDFVEALDVVSILQAKARRVLDAQGA